MSQTIEDDREFSPQDYPVMAPVKRILFAEPRYFDVTYVINAHMEGKVGTVDAEAAWQQWETVVGVYRDLGLGVDILPGVRDLPDLCFVANQSFPIRPKAGQPAAAILSNMANEVRRPEVGVLARYYRNQGWKTIALSDQDVLFEGMGDAMWHPGRRVIYGGYGFRTNRAAYTNRSNYVDAPVVALRLIDERFYHLDTCLAPLDEHTALWVPEAFDEAGQAMLRRCFPTLLRCPLDEAESFLACNGHCPDSKHFIVDSAAVKTMELVRQAGFTPIGVDTSEFRKSGGSVQCLKLELE